MILEIISNRLKKKKLQTIGFIFYYHNNIEDLFQIVFEHKNVIKNQKIKPIKIFIKLLSAIFMFLYLISLPLIKNMLIVTEKSDIIIIMIKFFSNLFYSKWLVKVIVHILIQIIIAILKNKIIIYTFIYSIIVFQKFCTLITIIRIIYFFFHELIYYF